MPSIQIKNVPEEVHRVYRQRAANSGQSLQEYLLHELISNSTQPTLDEVLDRVDARSGGELPVDFAVDVLHRERSAR